MEIPAKKTSSLVEGHFDYTKTNSREVWENIFGPNQESFLSPDRETMILDKTGPYGIGGMTFSTKIDRRGEGKDSRSWLTLSPEAMKNEREAIKASFQEGLEVWDGEHNVLYAAWNYADAPSLVGPHRHAQSIMTHHTHLGRINRENIRQMGVLNGESENHEIRTAILTDGGVDEALYEAPYDWEGMQLRCFDSIEMQDKRSGVIPETGFPKGALRFRVPKGLDVFDDGAIETDIESVIHHIDTVHRMVVARAKKAEAILNGSQKDWDKNREVYKNMVDAVIDGEKKKYPVILDGDSKELRLPLKDFTTYTMGFYMLEGDLFFFVSPSFFSGGGSIEKMGIELQRIENPEGHEQLLKTSRDYIRGVADRLNWGVRPEEFKGDYRE